MTGALARRGAPTVLAGAFALVYVLVSPPSLDLAAHMFRAKLFGAEGFGIWNNWWYAGHHTPGYSVLFPPAARLLTPQLAGALAATGTAALFETLANDRFRSAGLAGRALVRGRDGDRSLHRTPGVRVRVAARGRRHAGAVARAAVARMPARGDHRALRAPSPRCSWAWSGPRSRWWRCAAIATAAAPAGGRASASCSPR